MMFVKMCLEGKAEATEIDKYVEKWHMSDSEKSLAEYLGFTEEEYALWVEKPISLRHILFARKQNKPFRQTLEQTMQDENQLPIAARAASQKEAKEIIGWLRSTGRL